MMRIISHWLKMVERLHDNRCCWSRYRYYYWFTTFTCLANIYENGRSCYRITTIHGNFCILFEAIFLSIYLYTWERFKINGHIFHIYTRYYRRFILSILYYISQFIYEYPAGFEIKMVVW